jgi:very-short-patch-repair endonuclease
MLSSRPSTRPTSATSSTPRRCARPWRTREGPELQRCGATDGFVRTDSPLERAFLRIVKKAGLPHPRTQAHVNGHRVDFFWPELKLVVETDGVRYHRTAAQQAADRQRDHSHFLAGLTALRFTHGQVKDDVTHVEALLRRVAAA